MKTLTAKAGQSLFDIALQTYGSLDYLVKIAKDNAFGSVTGKVPSRRAFIWNENFIPYQKGNSIYNRSNTVLATDSANYGNVFFIPDDVMPQGDPIIPQPETEETMTLGTSYTSNADGTVNIVLADVDGNPLTGCTIVQVEIEVKPLKQTGDYTWNKDTSTLSLLGGLTLDKDATAFILYNKTV